MTDAEKRWPRLAAAVARHPRVSKVIAWSIIILLLVAGGRVMWNDAAEDGWYKLIISVIAGGFVGWRYYRQTKKTGATLGAEEAP